MAELVGLAIMWTMGPPLPQAKSCRATAYVAGQVVTVGGTWWETTPGAEKPNIKHWGNQVVAYDPAAKKWSSLPDYPRPVGYAAAAVVGDVLYVVGGCDGIVGGADGKDSITESYKMDFARKPLAWQKIAPLPRGVWAANAAVIGTTIYLVGGRTGSPSYTGQFEIIDDVLAFDTSKGDKAAWEKVTPVPTRREGAAVAAAGGKLYVIGGSFSQFGDEKATRSFNEVLCYDPAAKRWLKQGQLRQPTGWLAAVSCRERYIVILGGYAETAPASAMPDGKPKQEFTNRVWLFDTRRRVLMPGTPMPHAVLDCGAVCDGKTIYVCGGEDTPNRTRADWFQIGEIKAILPESRP